MPVVVSVRLFMPMSSARRPTTTGPKPFEKMNIKEKICSKTQAAIRVLYGQEVPESWCKYSKRVVNRKDISPS